MTRRRKGLFIVLEGPDKSGKSTQARALVGALQKAGVSVTHTREPGGTAAAEAVRKVLLDPTLRIGRLTELFLYEASRAQHVEEVIRPALKAGRVVVCERYTMSTDAYQGVGRGLGLKKTRALNAVATGGLKPDITFVVDIPPAEFHRRDAARVLDRLEREPDAFRDKVRAAYRRLARAERGAQLVDGGRPLPDVSALLLKRVLKALR